MLYTTLQYNGVEKSLADWGISEWDRDVANQANDHLQCTIPAAMDGASIFPYGANVIIRINRATSAINPTNPTLPPSGATSFSGGSQFFWGYRETEDRIGEPDSESLVYKFTGPYEWFFDKLVFQQSFLTWNGTKMVLGWQSDVILGLSLNTLTGQNDTVPGSIATNLMSLAQQVKQIAMYAQADSAWQQANNGLNWPATGAIDGLANPQFLCDQLTQNIDSVNFDLLNSPSANVLISDYALGATSGKTSASMYPGSFFPGTPRYQLRAPLDAVNAATCSECMKRQLQWIGGIGTPVVWTDHSQTPPQLHIATSNNFRAVPSGGPTLAQRLAGGNAITLPFTGITVKQKIKRRDDLIPAAAALKYKISGTNNGQPYNQTFFDIAAYLNTTTGAPGIPGAAGVALVEGIGVWDALYNVNAPTLKLTSALQAGLLAVAKTATADIQTLDLQGTSTKNQSCTIATTSISSALASASDPVWLQLFPELINVTGLSFFNGNDAPYITITSPDGSTVYYGAAIWNYGAIPNWVTDGQLASWMMASGSTPASPISGTTVKAKLTVRFAFTEKAQGSGSSTAVQSNVSYHEKNITLTLTTLTSGTYNSDTQYASGEPVPWGLAGVLAQLESIPQYEGSILVQETEISDVCPIGNTVNISGGRAEWASMFAVVQSVRYRDNGQTEITFGPATHLGAGKLFQRLRSNIGRQWYNLINPQPTNAGNSTAGALGQNLPALAPTNGAKNKTLDYMLTNIVDEIGDASTLPAGIIHDTGANNTPFTGTIASGQRPFGNGQATVWAFGPYGDDDGETMSWIRVSMNDVVNSSGGVPNLHPYFREIPDCKTISGTPTPGFRLVLCSEFYTTSIRSTPDP